MVSMMTHIFILIFIFHPTRSSEATSAIERLRDSILDFSTVSYNHLVRNNPQENILFSPFSVYSVLMMAHLGARGNTANQICETLQLCHLNTSTIHETFGKLLKDLETDASLIDSLEIANGVFLQRGLNISRSYDFAMRSLYSSALKEVDFYNDSLSSLIGVNAWVRQKTKGKIQAVLQRNPSLLTKMLLINAVHFKGQWKWQFDNQATEPFGHFYINPHQRIEVPIMTGKMFLAYGHNSKIRASILELPFTQNRLSMFLILPDSPTEILELNATSMKLLIGSMKKHDVNVRLPRFSIDKSPQLAGLLWNLGIKDLFSPVEADLSGIADNLFVSDMIHRALIHVDEIGSIASASTLILVERVGYVDEHYFEANRPFTFVVMDKQAGAVLFIGRIAKL